MEDINETVNLIKSNINDVDNLVNNLNNLKYFHKQLNKITTKYYKNQIKTIKMNIKNELMNYAKKYSNIDVIKKDIDAVKPATDDINIETVDIPKPELFDDIVYDALAKTVNYDIETLPEKEQTKLINDYQNIKNDIFEGLNLFLKECNELENYKPNYDTLHASVDAIYQLHLKYLRNVSNNIKTPYKCSINGIEFNIQCKQTEFMKNVIESIILN